MLLTVPDDADPELTQQIASFTVCEHCRPAPRQRAQPVREEPALPFEAPSEAEFASWKNRSNPDP